MGRYISFSNAKVFLLLVKLLLTKVNKGLSACKGLLSLCYTVLHLIILQMGAAAYFCSNDNGNQHKGTIRQ